MKRKIWMGMGLFLLGTGWASAQVPADSYFNDRRLAIPITMPASLRQDIAKLTLYVSADEGKTWRQEATAAANDQQFDFNAPTDGVFWFNVAYTNKAGQSVPREAEIYSGQPQLKVVVDTRQPILKLSAGERVAEVVSLSWEVRDEALDAERVKLEYKVEGTSEWLPLEIAGTESKGQKRFTVGTSGPVAVRLTAVDLAGNMSQTQIDVDQGTATVAGASKPAPAQTTSMVNEAPSMPLPTPPSGFAPNLPPTMPPVAGGGDSFRPAAGAPPASRPLASSAAPTAPRGLDDAPAGPGGMPLASSGPVAPAATSNPSRSYGGGPMLFTNQTRLELDYEIPKMGPSGVGLVELWVTTDNGRSWARAAEKQDPHPPITFDVPSEGVYGFMMIVKNKAGIGRKEPVSGDMPELRVEVDTTPPTAALYPVEADYSRKDTLHLIWKVEDKNLGTTPIRIQWSAQPGGPWEDVGPELPNNGRYKWKMPENLPYRIYLRLEARDQAGNVSVAETPEPVLVDLTEPEIRIKGLLPRRSH